VTIQGKPTEINLISRYQELFIIKLKASCLSRWTRSRSAEGKNCIKTTYGTWWCMAGPCTEHWAQDCQWFVRLWPCGGASYQSSPGPENMLLDRRSDDSRQNLMRSDRQSEAVFYIW